MTFSTDTVPDAPPEGDRGSTWDVATHGPVPRPDWVVTDLGAVDADVGLLTTGKEADVHVVRRRVDDGGGRHRDVLLAAERFPSHDHRLFHRDAGCLGGRPRPQEPGDPGHGPADGLRHGAQRRPVGGRGVRGARRAAVARPPGLPPRPARRDRDAHGVRRHPRRGRRPPRLATARPGRTATSPHATSSSSASGSSSRTGRSSSTSSATRGVSSTSSGTRRRCVAGSRCAASTSTVPRASGTPPPARPRAGDRDVHPSPGPSAHGSVGSEETWR